MKRFDILTIFPNILESYFKESILKRAVFKRLIKIVTHNLRDFSQDKHKKVDDTPYGGGPGMVLQIEPISKAVQFAKLKCKNKNVKCRSRIILFSTRGKKFDAETAKRLVKYDQLIFICGRYEGVDERVAEYIADEEISIGDFILSGGELPAAIVVESVARFIPGVLGKYESLEEVKGSYSVYTKPEVFVTKGKKKLTVPKVLVGGDHRKIDEWRARHSH